MNYSRGYQPHSYYSYNEPNAYHSIPNCHSKLSQNIDRHTRPAFEAMERFIGSFHSLVRVLESTVVATHSGFNAIIQLTQQYRTVKNSIGHIFGLFSMIRWIKAKFSKSCGVISVQEFDSFCNQKSSRTPIVMFMIITAIPLIISYFEQKKVTVRQPQPQLQQKKKCTGKLDFARALYSFKAKSVQELSLEPNDLIAILSKESNDWWRGRLKNGKTGYFPANHVEIIEKTAILETTSSPNTTIAPSA